MQKIVLVLFLIICLGSQLFAINFAGNSGFAIPLGSWSDEHGSGQFFSVNTDILSKDYLAIFVSFNVSTFAGKANSNYHFQSFSPGSGLKFYPLFFIDNSNLFAKASVSYNFIERSLHNAKETGNDLAVLSLIGAELKTGNNWIIYLSLGEKHFLGGIDMFVIGVGLGYKK